METERILAIINTLNRTIEVHKDLYGSKDIIEEAQGLTKIMLDKI